MYTMPTETTKINHQGAKCPNHMEYAMIYISMAVIGGLVTLVTSLVTESILSRQNQHEVDALEILEDSWLRD